MNALVLILIFIVIVAIIIYFVVKKVTKVEIFTSGIPSFSSKQYLDINFYYFDLSNFSSKYVYRIEIINNYLYPTKIELYSRMIVDENEISSFESSFEIDSKKKEIFDISLEDIFNPHKLSNINKCEKTKEWYEFWESEPECSKDKPCENNGYCAENCKCYYVSSLPVIIESNERKENRNIFCNFNPIVETEIKYSTKTKTVVDIPINEEIGSRRLNFGEAPFDIWMFINPDPYNNLLPLEVSFGIEGYNVKIDYINVSLVGYDMTIKTFFEERTQSIKSQNCFLEINKEINGKIFTKAFDKYCVFGPVEIITQTREREFVLNVSNETKEIIEKICKDKNLTECAKELIKYGYSLCSFYSELDICKYSEEIKNSIYLEIEVGFEHVLKYKKEIEASFCH